MQEETFRRARSHINLIISCLILASALHCPTDQFKCRYERRCVPLVVKCNGVDDCGDNSDEWNCKFTIHSLFYHAQKTNDNCCNGFFIDTASR